MKILILALFIASCAPLRPLAPKSASPYRVPPNVPSARVDYSAESITGIEAWDNVLKPWLGTPYMSGGASKSGTDCSGFVSSVYLEKEGMYIPRTTVDEYKMGKIVSKGDWVIGDLVFFGEKSKVNHVGIYVGNGNFIHASTSRGVMISPLSDAYWEPKYIGARRYL